MYYLNTDRLRVEIAAPEELVGKTTRFDYTGFITEVTLDGCVRFCTSEPRNLKEPSSGGRGLCSEIQFDPSGETGVGGYFPKLGVGLLKKPDEDRYRFFRSYECIPFETRVEEVPDGLCFTTLPQPCLGYAAQVTRTVTVRDNQLTMRMTLCNMGMKAFGFHEYCHNFMSLDGQSLGPDYLLELPGVSHLEERIRESRGKDVFTAEGNTLSFRHRPESSVKLNLEEGDLPEGECFRWKLSHRSSLVSVQCEEFYQPKTVPVWANDHMMCPEATFYTHFQPGDSCSWARRWTFEQYHRA